MGNSGSWRPRVLEDAKIEKYCSSGSPYSRLSEIASCLITCMVQIVQCILAWIMDWKITMIPGRNRFLWNGLCCFKPQTSIPEGNIWGIWAISKIISPPWLSNHNCWWRLQSQASWMCLYWKALAKCALFSLKCAVTGHETLQRKDGSTLKWFSTTTLKIGTHPFCFGILYTWCAFSFLGRCPAD